MYTCNWYILYSNHTLIKKKQNQKWSSDVQTQQWFSPSCDNWACYLALSLLWVPSPPWLRSLASVLIVSDLSFSFFVSSLLWGLEWGLCYGSRPVPRLSPLLWLRACAQPLGCTSSCGVVPVSSRPPHHLLCAPGCFLKYTVVAPYIFFLSYPKSVPDKDLYSDAYTGLVFWIEGSLHVPLDVSHACSSLGTEAHTYPQTSCGSTPPRVMWRQRGGVWTGCTSLYGSDPSSRAEGGHTCRAGRAVGGRGSHVLVSASSCPGLLVGISSRSPSLLSSPWAGVTCALVTSEVCGWTPKPSLILSLCI